MLFGEISNYEAIPQIEIISQGTIKNDLNLGFVLKTFSGISSIFAPVNFKFYRENGIIIYGEKGRLDILNEGLNNTFYPSNPSRSLSGANEISYDKEIKLDQSLINGFLNIYNNLSDALENKSPLLSNADSALKNEEIIENILNSVKQKHE